MMPPKRTVGFWLAVAAQVAVLVAVPLPKVLTLRAGRTVFLQVAPVDPYSIMSGYYATLSYDASLPGSYYPQASRKPEETTRSLLREYMSVMAFGATTATMAQLGLTASDLWKEYPHVRIEESGRQMPSVPGMHRGLDREGLLTTASLDGIRDRAAQDLLRQSVKTPFSDGERVYAVLEARSEGEPWRPVRLSGELPANLPPNQVALRARFRSWRMEFGLEQFFIPETEREDVDRELRENTRKARAEIRVDSKGNSALAALHIGNRTWRLK